jgi:hypothetical protein
VVDEELTMQYQQTISEAADLKTRILELTEEIQEMEDRHL